MRALGPGCANLGVGGGHATRRELADAFVQQFDVIIKRPAVRFPSGLHGGSLLCSAGRDEPCHDLTHLTPNVMRAV